MAFPYVERSALTRELPYSAVDFDYENDTAGWESFLDDLAAAESERVEGYLDRDFRDSTEYPDPASVPAVVRESVIRLVRARLARVREDGLSSMTEPSTAQYSYRPPTEIVSEIKQELADADLGTDSTAGGNVADLI